MTEDGRRVGVPWLGWTDGTCRYCTERAREPVPARHGSPAATSTAATRSWTVADERFCLPLPDGLPDEQAAPLLCGGLIGYRALTLTGDAERLGLYGFGSAAHMICQVAVYQGRRVFAFTRPGDERARRSSRGRSARRGPAAATSTPPEQLDARDHLRLRGPARAAGAERLAPGGTSSAPGST